MTSLLPYRFKRIASFATVVLLTACGGGDGGGAVGSAPIAPAMPASPLPAPGTAATPAPSPAPATASEAAPEPAPAQTVPAPSASSPLTVASATIDAADQIDGAYTLVPATAAASTGGESPYPDLSMLPTRIMAFQPIVFGDVSRIAVTSTR
jgi:hypothetical protein